MIEPTRNVALDRNRGAKILAIAHRLDCHGLAGDGLASGESPTDFEARCLAVVRERQAGGFLVRAVESLVSNPHSAPRYDDATGEVVQRWAAEAGIDDAGPRSIVIPFVDLARMANVQRDLSTNIATAGGFLVGTEVRIAEALKPWSVVMQSGATVIPNLRSGQVLPTPVTNTTISFSDAGGSASTPSLAAATALPKVGFGLTTVSRKLRLQSDAEAFLARDLLRIAGRSIDAMALGGSGHDGEPTGIVAAAGTTAVTGSSVTFAALTNGKAAATAGGAPSGAWISTPTVRGLLEQRAAFASTGTAIWANDSMCSWPAFATPDAPAATIVGGHFPSLFVLLFGAGVVVELNAFDPTLFAQGGVSLRVMIALDIALPIPSAFAVATGVS